MPKVDIVLAIMQAAMANSHYAASYGSTEQARLRKLYADMSNARNTLQGICQNQLDAGDVMAEDCVAYACANGPKPPWLTQAGIADLAA